MAARPDLPKEDVYWRLHGIGNARHSYSDDELARLRGMLAEAGTKGTAYVMFNNLPRTGDATRFAQLLADSGIGTGKRRSA